MNILIQSEIDLLFLILNKCSGNKFIVVKSVVDLKPFPKKLMGNLAIIFCRNNSQICELLYNKLARNVKL